MSSMLAPQVRSQFAKRLKAMRTQRGFQRARYFASTLGIEENRYTRYERAEVEPNLTLIHKMCETLRVTPNELLGFDPVPGTATSGRAHVDAGFSEPEMSARTSLAEPKGSDAVTTMAWGLASEIADIRSASADARKTADPLARVRETSAIYRSLLAEPFETIAKLAEDPALGKSSAKRKAEIADLMKSFTASLRAPRR